MPKPVSLQEVAQILAGQGIPAKVDGDPTTRITNVATLEDATEQDISFLSNPKYQKQLAITQAAAVVLRHDVELPIGRNGQPLGGLRVNDPYAAITVLLVKLHGYRAHRSATPSESPVHPTAQVAEDVIIHPSATVDADASIGAGSVLYPGVYVGPRCKIGRKVLLYPNVVIYDDCVLGDRVAVHAGTVIGEDGLGYAPVDGTWIKIPQIGHVEIGDDVEIGANCAIDRATLGKTVIGRGTKMSNLVTIGHGTRVGENCMIVAQVGLAGSVNVGNNVTIAGQVGCVGHITIGDGATIAAKAGVVNDVPPGATYLGQPAGPINEVRRQMAQIHKLPEIAKRVRRLEQVADTARTHQPD